jgi:ADP-ribosylglycohydrolase
VKAEVTTSRTSALARARIALEGLSNGDAFGERFFGSPLPVERRVRSRTLPSPPWYWTLAHQARASAEPTHAHPDAHAGAIAVAFAAALAWQMGQGTRERSGEALLHEVVRRTPSGATRAGLERAASLSLLSEPGTAVAELGNGSQVICSDTVPFALWCAARHLDFEEALWTTVSGLGDRDTTCAIAGGVVALSVGAEGIPKAFADAREPLASTLTHREPNAEAG